MKTKAALKTTKTAKLVQAEPPAKSGDDDANAGRRRQIMKEAARLFATRGFDATKIRDIAAAAGILGGSIYYHFASKEEIFLAVHSEGMATVSSAVAAAIEGVYDPWDRLEAAAIAHCEALLSDHDLPVLVSPYFSESIGGLRDKFVAQRDSYDRLIESIIAEIDMPPSVDRKIFRLHFLGALNWMPTWYRPHQRFTPREIGRQLVAMLRTPSTEAKSKRKTGAA